MRMVPAGLSRNSLRASTWASISSKCGPMLSSRRSPASVTETAWVVRVRSLMPSRASSKRMVWLRADCEMPILAAARVKLRSRATARKAIRSLMFSRGTHESLSWHRVHYIRICRSIQRSASGWLFNGGLPRNGSLRVLEPDGDGTGAIEDRDIARHIAKDDDARLGHAAAAIVDDEVIRTPK